MKANRIVVVAAAGLLALLALLSAGCIKDQEYLLHPGTAVTRSEAGLSVAKGSSIVLEMTMFKGTVIPDTGASFTLYLEIDPDLLVDGRRLDLPSSGVRAYLSILGESAEKTTERCLGVIEISEARHDHVVAKLDVRSEDPGLPWKFKEKVTFVLREKTSDTKTE